jgi:adenosylhomocysteine nucleosidase
MRTVLLVAAEPFELKYVPNETSNARYLRTTGGAGPRLAAAAIASFDQPFDVIVSTGMCGALDPSLAVGEIFVAVSVNGVVCRLPASRASWHSGALISVDRIVGTVAERKQLAGAGYAAVEMEASAVAEYAAKQGLDFYCIRAVSDTASEEFSVDLNAARDGSGRIRVRHILWQALQRPRKIVPELMRLQRNSNKAARALGAFLATCEF